MHPRGLKAWTTLPIVQSAPPTIAADPHHLTKGIGCGIVGFLLLALVFAAVIHLPASDHRGRALAWV
jgi:hypothetical protein